MTEKEGVYKSNNPMQNLLLSVTEPLTRDPILLAFFFQFYVGWWTKCLQSIHLVHSHFFLTSCQLFPLSLISSNTWLNNLVQVHPIGALVWVLILMTILMPFHESLFYQFLLHDLTTAVISLLTLSKNYWVSLLILIQLLGLYTARMWAVLPIFWRFMVPPHETLATLPIATWYGDKRTT
jgi:hypothetical protein